MWWVHLPLYVLWHHILWIWTHCHRQLSCPHPWARLVIIRMCLPRPLCWIVAGMVVRLRTYHCRLRHWLLLLSCLIFSILVGLVWFCLFRWGNFRLRLNLTLPLVYCRVVGTWIWRVWYWIERAYRHVCSCCCSCWLMFCTLSLLEIFGGLLFCSWRCTYHLLV